MMGPNRLGIEITKLQEAVRTIVDSTSSDKISPGVKMINILLQKKLLLPRLNQNVEGIMFSQDEIDHLDPSVKTAYFRTLDARDVSTEYESQVLKAKEKLEKTIDELKITIEKLSALEELKVDVVRF